MRGCRSGRRRSATGARSLLAPLDEGDFAVIEEHFACWLDAPNIDDQGRALLRHAWATNLPREPAMLDDAILDNAFGWVLVGVATKSAIGILRSWLAAGRNPRPYLHDSGPDHLDFDLALGFENHWAGLRDDFPPTEAIRAAFRDIGAFGHFGVPGPGIKDNPQIWETLISVARIRAVDAAPHRDYDWSRLRTQPLPLGGTTYRLDSDGQVRPVEPPPEFASWDEWLAVLSVRCGWAHARCAPAAVKALWAALGGG